MAAKNSAMIRNKMWGSWKRISARLPVPSTTMWISDHILGYQERGDDGRVKKGTAQPTQELTGQRVKPGLQAWLKSLPNPGKSRASSSQPKHADLEKKQLETNGIAVEPISLPGTPWGDPELAFLGHTGNNRGFNRVVCWWFVVRLQNHQILRGVQ